MLRLVLTASFILAVTASTPFKDCGSTGVIKSVDCPGCTKLPCMMKRGTNYNITVDFTSNHPANTLDNHLVGTFSGVTLPWPGTFPSGCDSLVAGDCPLQIGESVKYEVVLPISPSWPTVKAVAHWELLDENKAKVFCFEVPLQLY